MFTEERRFVIINEIEKFGKVSVSELAARFDVSEVTIRKDLNEITKYLPIKRTHGGAFLPTSISRSTVWNDRESNQFKEKDRIGMAAAALINPGETVILDAGTTIDRLAHHMEKAENVTCVVIEPQIAASLGVWPGVSIVISGGYMRADFPLWGPDCVRTILAYRGADKLFLAAGGISIEAGLRDAFTLTFKSKQAMIEAANEITLLVDSSKFGRVEGEKIASVDVIDRLITGRDAPKDVVDALIKKGIEVILV